MAERVMVGQTFVLPRWLIWFGALLLGSYLLRFLALEAPQELFPSTSIMLFWALPLWLASRLRNPYSQALVGIWIVWFCIGSCNLVASYLAYGDYYLVRADPAAILYAAGVTVVVVALLSTESFLRHRERRCGEMLPERVVGSTTGDLPSLYLLFLLLFPFAYLVSMVAVAGQPPILLGRAFAEDIYETEYGPLYGYGTVLVFSILAVLGRTHSSRGSIVRLGWALLLLLYLLIAIADGKRFYAMIALLAMFPLYAPVGGHGHLRPRMMIGTLLAMGVGGVIYLGVLLIRAGYELPIASVLPYALAAVGVEYRDFVYSVSHFTPGSIPGYDWLGSTFFSLLNAQVLSAVGIDKAAETLKGSAYVWRDLLGTGVGIRTGIICELYFAYGILAAPPLFLLGMLVGVVTSQLTKPDRGSAIAFWAVLYAIAVLMIVGQSTSTAGLVSLVGYTYCVYWACGKVTLAAKASALASPTEYGRGQ